MQQRLDLDSLLRDPKSAGRPPPTNRPEVIAEIEGLHYVPDYIEEDEHDRLLSWVDEQTWLDDLKRRVQHYGFKYNYRARRVDHTMRIGALEPCLKDLSEGLYPKHMSEVADQVIINEYEPGQGIASHIDCEPCFEDTIVSLSLGSGCVMDFRRKSDPKHKVPIWLAPRSLVVLKGEARYQWTHGIAARKQDTWEGRTYKRERRVSLTFRKVILRNG